MFENTAASPFFSRIPFRWQTSPEPRLVKIYDVMVIAARLSRRSLLSRNGRVLVVAARELKVQLRQAWPRPAMLESRVSVLSFCQVTYQRRTLTSCFSVAWNQIVWLQQRNIDWFRGVLSRDYRTRRAFLPRHKLASSTYCAPSGVACTSCKTVASLYI